MAGPRPLRPGPGRRLRRQGRRDHRRRLREGRPLTPTAWISEHDADDLHGDPLLGYVDHYWAGRFHGHIEHARSLGERFEDGTLDEAVTWARARADKVIIRIGDDVEYVIGVPAHPDVRPWPEGGVPNPPRRRWASERWKDRTDADPDADWAVTLALAPPEWERRPEYDAVVAEVADALGATWSSAPLDGFLADLRRAERRARGNREFGWTTSNTATYEVPVAVRAPTAARARERAEALVPDLPDGWRLGTSVRFDG